MSEYFFFFFRVLLEKNMLFGYIVVIKRTEEDGTRFPLLFEQCMFGRSAECDIRVQLPNVAKEHCKLEIDKEKKEYVFKWMLQNVKSDKEIFFGGVYGGECKKLLAGNETQIAELSSNQEEADDRIMFHINDGVVKHGVQSVLVDSPDTDVFVNLIFHFNTTWQLQKLYVKLGNRKTKKTVPVHLLVDQLDNGLVLCLPAIHALSGCDSTSKVGPKLSGLKASIDLSLLEGFGVKELSPQITSNAEKLLVSGLKKTDCSTFDEYRWEQYHNSKKELDFNQLVCCSSTIREHIKRAYLQCKMWLQAPTPAVTKPDPLQYGYEATDVGITPVILPAKLTILNTDPEYVLVNDKPVKNYVQLNHHDVITIITRKFRFEYPAWAVSKFSPRSSPTNKKVTKNNENKSPTKQVKISKTSLTPAAKINTSKVCDSGKKNVAITLPSTPFTVNTSSISNISKESNIDFADISSMRQNSKTPDQDQNLSVKKRKSTVLDNPDTPSAKVLKIFSVNKSKTPTSDNDEFHTPRYDIKSKTTPTSKNAKKSVSLKVNRARKSLPKGRKSTSAMLKMPKNHSDSPLSAASPKMGSSLKAGTPKKSATPKSSNARKSLTPKTITPVKKIRKHSDTPQISSRLKLIDNPETDNKTPNINIRKSLSKGRKSSLTSPMLKIPKNSDTPVPAASPKLGTPLKVKTLRKSITPKSMSSSKSLTSKPKKSLSLQVSTPVKKTPKYSDSPQSSGRSKQISALKADNKTPNVKSPKQVMTPKTKSSRKSLSKVRKSSLTSPMLKNPRKSITPKSDNRKKSLTPKVVTPVKKTLKYSDDLETNNKTPNIRSPKQLLTPKTKSSRKSLSKGRKSSLTSPMLKTTKHSDTPLSATSPKLGGFLKVNTPRKSTTPKSNIARKSLTLKVTTPGKKTPKKSDSPQASGRSKQIDALETNNKTPNIKSPKQLLTPKTKSNRKSLSKVRKSSLSSPMLKTPKYSDTPLSAANPKLGSSLKAKHPRKSTTPKSGKVRKSITSKVIKSLSPKLATPKVATPISETPEMCDTSLSSNRSRQTNEINPTIKSPKESVTPQAKSNKKSASLKKNSAKKSLSKGIKSSESPMIKTQRISDISPKVVSSRMSRSPVTKSKKSGGPLSASPNKTKLARKSVGLLPSDSPNNVQVSPTAAVSRKSRKSASHISSVNPGKLDTPQFNFTTPKTNSPKQSPNSKAKNSVSSSKLKNTRKSSSPILPNNVEKAISPKFNFSTPKTKSPKNLTTSKKLSPKPQSPKLRLPKLSTTPKSGKSTTVVKRLSVSPKFKFSSNSPSSDSRHARRKSMSQTEPKRKSMAVEESPNKRTASPKQSTSPKNVPVSDKSKKEGAKTSKATSSPSKSRNTPKSAYLVRREREIRDEMRRKRVSFAPALSPEQFDTTLPPSTPIKHGALPLTPWPSMSKVRINPPFNQAINKSDNSASQKYSFLSDKLSLKLKFSSPKNKSSGKVVAEKNQKIVTPQTPDEQKSKALLAVHAKNLGSSLKKTPKSVKKPKTPISSKKLSSKKEQKHLFSEILKHGLMKKTIVHAKKPASLKKNLKKNLKKVIGHQPKTPRGLKNKVLLVARSTGHYLSPETFYVNRAKTPKRKSVKKSKLGTSSKRNTPKSTDISPISSRNTPEIPIEMTVSPLTEEKKNSRRSKIKLTERFIQQVLSPLSPEASSPNDKSLKSNESSNSPEVDYTEISSVKKLTRTRKTPMADYTNVGGVKRIMKTPGKTPRADYTNVAGVRRIMKTPGKTPKADYTNVAGVRRIMKTPGKTPKADYTNVAGVRRIMKTSGKTPKADYTNVGGVRRIMKTPGKTPKADYTNVAGVKRIVRTPSKTPKADYTNVAGIKRIMKTPGRTPEADYTNVAGIKRIMRTPNKTPEADYTNVAGVKRIMRTPNNTPEADYTNVVGVKRIMRTPNKTPKADYTNVAGVKRIMRSGTPLADYTEVTGVKMIMRTPETTEKTEQPLLATAKSNVIPVVEETEPSNLPVKRTRGGRSNITPKVEITENKVSSVKVTRSGRSNAAAEVDKDNKTQAEVSPLKRTRRGRTSATSEVKNIVKTQAKVSPLRKIRSSRSNPAAEVNEDNKTQAEVSPLKRTQRGRISATSEVEKHVEIQAKVSPVRNNRGSRSNPAAEVNADNKTPAEVSPPKRTQRGSTSAMSEVEKNLNIQAKVSPIRKIRGSRSNPSAEVNENNKTQAEVSPPKRTRRGRTRATSEVEKNVEIQAKVSPLRKIRGSRSNSAAEVNEDNKTQAEVSPPKRTRRGRTSAMSDVEKNIKIQAKVSPVRKIRGSRSNPAAEVNKDNKTQAEVSPPKRTRRGRTSATSDVEKNVSPVRKFRGSRSNPAAIIENPEAEVSPVRKDLPLPTSPGKRKRKIDVSKDSKQSPAKKGRTSEIKAPDNKTTTVEKIQTIGFPVKSTRSNRSNAANIVEKNVKSEVSPLKKTRTGRSNVATKVEKEDQAQAKVSPVRKTRGGRSNAAAVAKEARVSPVDSKSAANPARGKRNSET
ncbi:Proliferation marker protein Ki-67 [Nymphon striatum]|nr:Proliferation marker protein Ki-67 [Nymphon striatum]